MYAGAYFHVVSSQLDKIVQVQRSFLHKLNISEACAFLEYNFAPTELRRNIAILGMLHKRVIGKCHPSFDRLLPWREDHISTPRGFGHNKQLYGHWLEATHHRALYVKSIFFHDRHLQ